MSLVKPHYLGVKALLDADPAIKVKDRAQLEADGQLSQSQYVILYPTGPDELEDDRFTKEQDLDSTAEFVFTLKAVAVTGVGCADVVDHVLAALVGKVPAVAGRTVDPMRYVEMSDVQPDFDSKPPLYFANIDFSLTSRRA